MYRGKSACAPKPSPASYTAHVETTRVVNLHAFVDVAPPEDVKEAVVVVPSAPLSLVHAHCRPRRHLTAENRLG